MKSTTLALACAVFALPTVLLAQDSRPAKALERVKTQASAAIQSTDSYPLSTCVVSGKTLKAEKTKVVQIEGRTIKVCCGKCVKKVSKNPAPYLVKLDAAVIAQQSAQYPLETCPVSGKRLDSKKKIVNVILDGHLVKVCCKKCARKAQSKKAELIAKVTKAAYAQQIAGHEAGKGLTCVVSGKPADRKGKAQMIMHGNRLYAVCCKNCLKKFKADPYKFLPSTKVKASSRPKSEDGDGDDDDDDDDDEHDEHKHKH